MAQLLAVVPAEAQSPAAERTIVNTAEAAWRSSEGAGRATSNTIRLPIANDVTSIGSYIASPNGGVRYSITQPRCGAAPIDISAAALQSAAPTQTALVESTKVRIGDTLFFRVHDRSANRDPNAIDSIEVIVAAPSGDEERLTIFETGENTGDFVGGIRTSNASNAPVAGDCTLDLEIGNDITVSYLRQDGQPRLSARVSAFVRPSGFVFDSRDGMLVNGAQVTLIDETTGRPATLFAEDGITPWPSTVVTGSAIALPNGTAVPLADGEYVFPLVGTGSYRLIVEAPAPYRGPSEMNPSDLAGLRGPGGDPFFVADASYAAPFFTTEGDAVEFDIPLDRDFTALSISKTASRQVAAPGDVVVFSVIVGNPDSFGPRRDVIVTDTPSPWLRLRRDSVRIDGEKDEDAVTVSPDGRTIRFNLEEIAPNAVRRLTYAMNVREDAPQGAIENRASVEDRSDEIATAVATIRVQRDVIADRMTLIGRITEGDCSLPDNRRGIPGVRVLLEDGSFAITDIDGRYHFEGLIPGTHVVQAQERTLPEGGRFVDCSRSTANAGATNSRFVRGQGGSLVVADFHAILPSDWSPPVAEANVDARDDAQAAGADIDWIAIGDGPTDFLFPEVGHNPRAPAIRVAIRHRLGEKVELTANGENVDPLAFDGIRKSADGTYAVSVWRAVALKSEQTELRAAVLAADGSKTVELTRIVDFAAAPARAQIVADRSNLVADGRSRPVIAVRITDRKGRPVRNGVSGSVSINAPYESAQAIEAMQLRQLTGLGGASPTWTVEGDDGIALISLAPTMVSGPLHLTFEFTDRQITRRHELESWIVPGDQEWTVVGLVEGSAGARSVADNMQRSGRFDSDLGEDARVALYVKGRVLGKFLVTAAYDSAKQREEERLGGAIDPNAYYTVYGDASVRRFDAASRGKLYVRVETDTFYAIYGDFRTGFDQTDLARYDRAATGIKAEGRFGALHVQGFAADTTTRFRRDEIQGSGLSGPYRLSDRRIVVNSERVVIETRDRFRSELIVERRELERFVDYDIDLLSGTITFKQPVLSRDFALNPQFIVIDYEIDDLVGTGKLNAGIRGSVTATDGDLRLGASAISDQGDGDRTDMIAADLRSRLGDQTELRAEIGASIREGATAVAWQVEATHLSGQLDLLAYARSIEDGYGVGQQNAVERGRTKFGADARYTVSEDLSVTGSVWRDDSLTDAARRNAAQLQTTWRNGATDLRLGIAHFSDRFQDRSTGSSTVLEAGASQRLLENRLEVNASTSIALENTDSIDLPTRHRLGARYAVTNSMRLVGAYEVAKGDAIDARTIRGGVELTPWAGARMNGTLGQQTISEYGPRSFAAFGLAQSLPVSPELTVDFTLDGNGQIGGVDPAKVINPLHPVASGGHLSQDGQLFEDFFAFTAGANWRKDRWAANFRGEYRDGELADRKGLTFGAIRQLGEGSVVGSGFTWTAADTQTGSSTEIFDGAVALAHRPEESPIALLAKLEFRSDEVTGAIAGETGPAGRTALLVDGDAKSRRLIGSLSTNWSPKSGSDDDKGFAQRVEIGVFLGGRYNFDRIEDYDASGFSALGGLDMRLGIGKRFEIGGRATVRSNLSDGYTKFSVGPELGFTPAKNMLLTIGYNISGFRDEDFSASRTTDKGFFTKFRLKLDADSFAFLGISR
ncbi:hypothetical protein E3U23_10935 [Erythrobacter litoralis]|nr:hypothetical protein [Erythrobacter litoralis]